MAWQIETEKSFGAKSEISPEIGSRNQQWDRRSAAAGALQMGNRRDVGGREQAVEDVGGYVGQGRRMRSTESCVRGVLEAAGDNFAWNTMSY